MRSGARPTAASGPVAPRAFDEHQALIRARDLFWSRGYSATSVQDLVDEPSVQRGNLYAAFGDEHDLYLKAVVLYAQENRERLEVMLDAGPVLPALRRMLTEPAALTGAQEGAERRRGCLVATPPPNSSPAMNRHGTRRSAKALIAAPSAAAATSADDQAALATAALVLGPAWHERPVTSAR